MKIISFLFAIYIFALSLVPCGDGGGGILAIINKIIGIEHVHLTDHEQHSNDCGDDACTTFCICSCCSSALDTPTKLPFLVKAPMLIQGTSPSFIPNFISAAVYVPIWQPPRYS
ncbi:MAG: hypothetical protein ACI8P3_004198 [Saprospiraceae bacterium]|jgi:hypothetical protein